MSIQSISAVTQTNSLQEYYEKNEKQIVGSQFQEQQAQFEKFDEDGDGYLDELELRELRSQLGKNLEDQDNDGKITLNDFNKVFYF